MLLKNKNVWALLWDRASHIFLTLFFICGSLLTLFIGDTSWDERAPTLIVLLCTGASLSVSGAVIQSYFQNPLASPSILGVSCGGSLFVVLVFTLNLQATYTYSIPIAAFCGSLLTLFLVYTLARRKGQIQTTNLILTGIALSTFLYSIEGAITFALRENWQMIQNLTEWQAGSTLDRSWRHVHMQLPVTLIGLMGCYHYRNELNILALGEEEAKNLGVEVAKVRYRLFVCISLLIGGAIAAVGILPFFGLVLPHVIRRIQGANNRTLIPLCMFAGSLSLLYMDLLLRVFRIQAFSIGNLSAIIGGAFFLALLIKTPNEKYYATS